MSETGGAGMAPTIEGQIKTIDEQAFAEVAHRRLGEIAAKEVTLDPAAEAAGLTLDDVTKLGPERVAALMARFTPPAPTKAAPVEEVPSPLTALQGKLSDKLGAAAARDVIAILAPLVQAQVTNTRATLTGQYPELKNDGAWNAVMKLGGDPAAIAATLYGARSRPLNTSETSQRRTGAVTNGKVTAEDKLFRGFAVLAQGGDMAEAHAAMGDN